MHKHLKTFLTVILTLTSNLAAQATTDHHTKAEKSDAAEDSFFQTNGKGGVNVAFDCSPKNSKSPYCMIRIKDLDNGVVCLGLVSSEKVVNPALSCVPAK